MVLLSSRWAGTGLPWLNVQVQHGMRLYRAGCAGLEAATRVNATGDYAKLSLRNGIPFNINSNATHFASNNGCFFIYATL
jgi:hypothetical protein